MDDLLARATELKDRISAYNIRVGIQEEKYATYVGELFGFNLTPETLNAEISRLEAQLLEVGEALSQDLDRIEESLT